MEVDVLLVGGGVASARCARALRRNGFGGSILLVGDEPSLPYNRPPLSKEILRGAPEDLLIAEPARWYERHSVTVRSKATVDRVDPSGRVATLVGGEPVEFRRCLLATGAAPNPLRIPGGEHAMMLRTAVDARRIREAAAATVGREVVVIGGGLIGVEVAASLATLDLRPTIVEITGALWGGALGSLFDAWARERLADAGVDVLLGASASAIGDDGVAVGDRALPAAFVVCGIGVRPRDEIAAAAGLATSRGIEVGTDQRTSDRSVWAAGDATRLDGRATEHWHGAREAGERAALSMLGLDVPPPRAPWTFTEIAGIGVDVFGEADRDDAEEWIGEAVIARTRGSALTQLIVIGSALPADTARRMVEERVSRTTIAASIAASGV